MKGNKKKQLYYGYSFRCGYSLHQLIELRATSKGMSKSEYIVECIINELNKDEKLKDNPLLKKVNQQKEIKKIQIQRYELKYKMFFPSRMYKQLKEAIDYNCNSEHIQLLINNFEQEAYLYDDDRVIEAVNKLKFIDLTKDEETWRPKLLSEIKIIKGLKCEVDLNDNNN